MAVVNYMEIVTWFSHKASGNPLLESVILETSQIEALSHFSKSVKLKIFFTWTFFYVAKRRRSFRDIINVPENVTRRRHGVK